MNYHLLQLSKFVLEEIILYVMHSVLVFSCFTKFTELQTLMEKEVYPFASGIFISLLLELEFSSGWRLFKFGTGLQMNGVKSGSVIDSCLFPLVASFLPSIAALPDQMLDFSGFHAHFR